MFQTLIASNPQAHFGAGRHLLALSFHGVVVAGAVALTRHPFTAAHSRPPEPPVLFLAPRHAPKPLPAPSHGPDGRIAPAPPTWQPKMEAPDLGPPVLPSTAPAVASLLEGAYPRLDLDHAVPAAAELLTAASVDEPVGVVEQRPPRYPPALERAGITGRVELEYVVDTTGSVEPGSLRTALTTHPDFEVAAQATVLASRYTPARLRGSAVRQLVRQTFRFRVGE